MKAETYFSLPQPVVSTGTNEFWWGDYTQTPAWSNLRARAVEPRDAYEGIVRMLVYAPYEYMLSLTRITPQQEERCTDICRMIEANAAWEVLDRFAERP